MLLQTTKLSYGYANATPISFPDLQLETGEAMLLLGASGSGKTTLLSLLGGLLPVQQGEIWLNAQAMHSLRGAALDAFRAKHIGIVFQQMFFAESLSVLDNVLLAARMGQQPVSKQAAIELLDRLGIGHKEKKYPAELSLGEQQRVSIARALLNRPALLLCDEPTSSLDDAQANNVAQLLIEQSAAYGAALMIVTHDQRLKTVFQKQIQL